MHRFITRQFPESDQARADLAAAFERLGERDQTIESCRSALTLNPDNSDAKALLERLE